MADQDELNKQLSKLVEDMLALADKANKSNPTLSAYLYHEAKNTARYWLPPSDWPARLKESQPTPHFKTCPSLRGGRCTC